MARAGKSRKREAPPKTLKGWKAIGQYLGIGDASHSAGPKAACRSEEKAA